MNDPKPPAQRAFAATPRIAWLGIAVIVALLLFVPTSRRIVVHEAGNVFSNPDEITRWLGFNTQFIASTPPTPPTERYLDHVAATDPRFDIQIACAVERWPQSEVAQHLDAIVSRFSNSAPLLALRLNYSSNDINWLRPDEELLIGIKPIPDTRKLPTAAQLVAYDAAAVAGERLNPQNAYFPAMRAVGLFASNRDADAIAALHVAASDTEWNDYDDTELASRWAFQREILHDDTALSHAMIRSSLPLLYGKLRGVARLAVYRAVVDEKGGDSASGFAIRHDLMRVGSLMRVHSSTLVGSLVGGSIERFAEQRPGGAQVEKQPAGVANDDWTLDKQARYEKYLESIGEPQEPVWAKSEMNADNTIRALNKRAPAVEFGPVFVMLFCQLCGMTIIACVIWFLSVRVLSRLFRRWQAKRTATVVFCLASMALLITLFFSIEQWAQATVDFAKMFQFWDIPITNAGRLLLRAKPIAVLGTLLPPLFFSLCVFVAHLKLRQPLLKLNLAAAPAVAFALLLVYCVALVPIARSEANVNDMLRQTSISEGAYIAKQVGVVWPK